MRSLLFALVASAVCLHTALAGPCEDMRAPFLVSETHAATSERLLRVYKRVLEQSEITPQPTLCEGINNVYGMSPVSYLKWRTIVVPPRLTKLMSDEELEGGMAHEVAHFYIGNFNQPQSWKEYIGDESYVDVVASLWVGVKPVTAFLKGLTRICWKLRECDGKGIQREMDLRVNMLKRRFATAR